MRGNMTPMIKPMMATMILCPPMYQMSAEATTPTRMTTIIYSAVRSLISARASSRAMPPPIFDLSRRAFIQSETGVDFSISFLAARASCST